MEPALAPTHSVRFVFFDHGGTLAHIKKDTPQITFEVLHELGYNFSQEEVNRAIASAEAFWDEKYRPLPRGQRSNFEAYYRHALQYLGVREEISAMARKVDSEWHDRAGITVYPYTIPCLEALKRQGLHLGIITQNLLTTEEVRRLHLAREGIEHYFSVIVSTESAGFDKPDKRLYLKAAEIAGYSPEEIMHVGDSYELDVVGARSAGMRAVLLDRSGKLPSGDCETIKSLLALSGLLN